MLVRALLIAAEEEDSPSTIEEYDGIEFVAGLTLDRTGELTRSGEVM